MIIYDFNLVGITIGPDETDSPLIIDANAVLPLPTPLQSFQPIPRRNPQILKYLGPVENQQFSSGDPFDIPEPWHILVGKQRLGFAGAK